jgi:hypothetical protein
MHMTRGKRPDNVVPFERAKAKQKGEGDLFTLLSRIDELEEALEVMDEAKVTTRNELEELIGRLEAEAAAMEDPDQT